MMMMMEVVDREDEIKCEDDDRIRGADDEGKPAKKSRRCVNETREKTFSMDDSTGTNSRVVRIVDHDFLGAIKLKKDYLVRNNGDQINVESLRGKIICLYFASLRLLSCPSNSRHFYESLMKTNKDSFEMVFVPLPVKFKNIDNITVFNDLFSTFPCLAVGFEHLDWRIHLSNLYYSPGPNYWFETFCFFDTRNEDITFNECPEHDLYTFGAQLYPFTPLRLLEVREQFNQLGTKTSIGDILGSDSRNFLINSNGDHVLLSTLEDKDVALYGYYEPFCFDLHDLHTFTRELEVIYGEKRGNNFEIVFINLQHKGGYYERASFDNAIAEMPWLALPFDDDKIWNLQDMMYNGQYLRSVNEVWWEYPILFIKPKHGGLLDPYGYQVLKKYGLAAFPFTRKDAARAHKDSLKKLSFNSFVERAEQLGLDFRSLIRNKSIGIMAPETTGRGILLLFSHLFNLSEKVLDSLVDAYTVANRSSSPFEVIFVSLDDNTEEFCVNFSDMPWHAVKNPLTKMEHTELLKSTIGFDIAECSSHFIAFGDDGNFLRVGITKSFENCKFPFLDDEEYTKHLTYCITSWNGWTGEADHTYRNRKDDGWWNTTLCLEEA